MVPARCAVWPLLLISFLWSIFCLFPPKNVHRPPWVLEVDMVGCSPFLWWFMTCGLHILVCVSEQICRNISARFQLAQQKLTWPLILNLLNLRLRVLFLWAVSPVTTPTQAPGSCHDGWYPFGTDCYLFKPDKYSTWSQAEDHCRGAYHVEIIPHRNSQC